MIRLSSANRGQIAGVLINSVYSTPGGEVIVKNDRFNFQQT